MPLMTDSIAAVAISLIERGWMPDAMIRAGIRQLLRVRLASLARTWTDPRQQLQQFVEMVSRDPVAVATDSANQQHYEVPAAFYDLVLGPQKKYSSCHYPKGDESLAAAEESALQITAERAGLGDGQTILELGCGWGSLTLWMARQFPAARITAISNSASQREYILGQARDRGIDRNLTVLTCDINHFQPEQRFDRIVSVEMFEHVRNHARLLERISGWMQPDGSLFVHIFCHRQYAYLFETQGAANWMGRHFFTGGMMPSADLLDCYHQDLEVTRRWQWNGRHYARTANQWAENLERNRTAILALFERIYGSGEGLRWLMRWKVFFLACAELFGYRDGNEWLVGHYLMQPVRNRSGETRPMLEGGSPVKADSLASR